MTMPVRIQRKRVKGWRMPENTVYVGRPTKYGNPYQVSCQATDEFRKQQIQKYKQSMSVMLKQDAVKELNGKNLACFCPLDKPCHADVLLDIANRNEKQQNEPL
jgi:hypothetical protein